MSTSVLKEVMEKIALLLNEMHSSNRCSIAVWEKKGSIALITNLGI